MSGVTVTPGSGQGDQAAGPGQGDQDAGPGQGDQDAGPGQGDQADQGNPKKQDCPGGNEIMQYQIN